MKAEMVVAEMLARGPMDPKEHRAAWRSARRDAYEASQKRAAWLKDVVSEVLVDMVRGVDGPVLQVWLVTLSDGSARREYWRAPYGRDSAGAYLRSPVWSEPVSKSGRPKTIDDCEIRRLRSEGLSVPAIVQQTGVSRAAVYRALALGDSA